MAMVTSSANAPAGTAFVTSREFDATREWVWDAYEATDAARKTFQDGMDSMQQGWAGIVEQFADYLKQAV